MSYNAINSKTLKKHKKIRAKVRSVTLRIWDIFPRISSYMDTLGNRKRMKPKVEADGRVKEFATKISKSRSQRGAFGGKAHGGRLAYVSTPRTRDEINEILKESRRG
jgi:hypothetical protein